MAITAEPAVRADGLGRRYGDRPALHDVSFELRAGSSLVVFGPNGAGKSTLLRILATLLRPTTGSAHVLGREVRREGWAVRGRIGFLGHDPLLHGDLSARENLSYHARLHGLRRAEAGDRIEQLLAAVGLQRRGDDRVQTYSRGMTQRLAVCRAILHDPQVLLLDEPRANLDPAATELLDPLIGRASGRTRVITSHDPAGGLAEADIALGLRYGEVALLAPAAGVSAADIGELYR